MPGRKSRTPGTRTDLAAFLREERQHILADWEKAARAIPRAAQISRPRLLDFIPTLLDRITELVEELRAGRAPALPTETAERHALDRLAEGVDLEQVIVELSLLRDCVFRLRETAASVAHPDERAEHRLLNQAIDRAIVASATQYTEARDRILRVLDRVSSTALEASSLDDILQELIVAFREEVSSVDTAAVLLRDGEVLTVRAATGLEEDVSEGFTLRVGEGFAGMIAAERRPLQLRSAATDPLVKSEIIRAKGLEALYGVPLIAGDEVLGVAHIGSLTAEEFSEQDRVLFSFMASRATAGIYQHELFARAEQRARELQESERRFRATFENAAVGIAHVALDGTWLRLNKKYCEILGYSRDELMKRRFQDVTHPDDLQADLENVERLVAGDAEAYTMEKRYVAKDGRTVWGDLSVSLVREGSGTDYFVAAVQDITAQVRLRERITFLSRASEVLSSTLDLGQTLQNLAELAIPVLGDWCAVDLVDVGESLGEFIAVAHRDPDKVAFVRELRRRYPPRPDAPTGAANVIRTGESELIREVDDEFLRRSALDETHLDLIRQLGLRSYLCVPLAQAGRGVGALSLATSESGRLFGSDDLDLARELARRAAAAIENARLHGEAARAITLRDQILAIVSHDLRNPIGTIDLASNLLQRSRALSDDPNASRQIEVIRRGTTRASRLIDDLLDVSSIQAGKLTLELSTFELTPLLVEAIEANEPLAQEKGIELRSDLPVEGHYIRCDRERLLQVLSNLLGNALKFCSAGDCVVVGADPRERDTLVSVADTGPGIADEDLEHIFDLYWMGRRGERGTGLGLFISKGIVESHGGRLWAESRIGQGSTFYFTLPASTGQIGRERRSALP